MKQITIILSAFFIQFSASAQEAPKVKTEKDGIVITYQFSELTGKRAEEGPQELCLFVKNNNDHAMKVQFSVVFFEDGAVDEESGDITLCIEPGKEVKGKKLGLCLLIDEDNDKNMAQGSFDWDLEELHIEEGSCN